MQYDPLVTRTLGDFVELFFVHPGNFGGIKGVYDFFKTDGIIMQKGLKNHPFARIQTGTGGEPAHNDFTMGAFH